MTLARAEICELNDEIGAGGIPHRKRGSRSFGLAELTQVEVPTPYEPFTI